MVKSNLNDCDDVNLTVVIDNSMADFTDFLPESSVKIFFMLKAEPFLFIVQVAKQHQSAGC